MITNDDESVVISDDDVSWSSGNRLCFTRRGPGFDSRQGRALVFHQYTKSHLHECASTRKKAEGKSGCLWSDASPLARSRERRFYLGQNSRRGQVPRGKL